MGEQGGTLAAGLVAEFGGTICGIVWKLSRSATAARSGAKYGSPARARPPPMTMRSGSSSVMAAASPSARASMASRQTVAAAGSPAAARSPTSLAVASVSPVAWA